MALQQIKKIEYFADLLPDGHLSIPEEIKSKLRLNKCKKFKVSIEMEEKNKKEDSKYSFNKVRKLLGNVKGQLSDDILEERKGCL